MFRGVSWLLAYSCESWKLDRARQEDFGGPETAGQEKRPRVFYAMNAKNPTRGRALLVPCTPIHGDALHRISTLHGRRPLLLL